MSYDVHTFKLPGRNLKNVGTDDGEKNEERVVLSVRFGRTNVCTFILDSSSLTSTTCMVGVLTSFSLKH